MAFLHQYLCRKRSSKNKHIVKYINLKTYLFFVFLDFLSNIRSEINEQCNLFLKSTHTKTKNKRSSVLI